MEDHGSDESQMFGLRRHKRRWVYRQDGGGIDWLRKAEYAAEEDDFGYKSFIESVDALVMGRNSFGKNSHIRDMAL